LQWRENGALTGNVPVLVIYRDGKEATDGEHHACFASDVAPFYRWPILYAVTGWESLCQ
jgi:hypothetical protein